MTTKQAEQLKDRRDYRATLIQRRDDIERKIERVEDQIKKIKESAKEAA